MNKLNNDQEKEMTEWLHSEEFNQFFTDKQPSEQLDERFYSLLEKERKPAKPEKNFTWFLRFALPLTAILLAFFIGQQFSETVQSPDKENFASELLTSENVGRKISMVSNTKIKDDTDEKVIEALLFSLSNDESVNVRLACINTLYDYAYLPRVRAGLISAVSSQQSPIVLANLAEAINASGKKLTKEEFMSLINKDLPPPIKNTIDASLIKI